MARHLMAVCVVCLLCAEHLPCKEHILDTGDKLSKSLNFPRQPNEYNEGIQLRDPLNSNKDYSYVFDKKKEKTKALTRVKRHSSHGHDVHHHHPHEIFDLTKVYIEKLFTEFGFSKGHKMDVYGFEKILRKLNLSRLETETSETSRSPAGTDNCVNGLDFILKITDQKSTKLDEYRSAMGYEEEHDHTHNHDHEEDENQSSESSSNLTQLLDEVKRSLLIEPDDMKSICPILLYHLTAATLNEQAGCVDKEVFHAHATYPIEDFNEMEDRFKVWLYATLAIILVSLCGLFGVAVIPIMEKHFYQHVIQFLVALAVGTLCGDALLHLIPHAMMTSIDGKDIHESMMYKGLAAVLGIIAFYFFERFLTMITEWRQKKQKRDNPSSRVRVMRDPENVSLNNGLSNEKVCKHKYSSYPYCYDEIAMDTKDDHHEHNNVEKLESSLNHSGSHSHCSHKRTNSGKFLEHADLVTTPDIAQNLVKKTQNGTAAVDICNFNKNSFNSDIDNNTVSTNLEDGSIESNMCGNHNQGAVTKPLMQEENYTIILREHESKHHGHSHTHGHVHSPPENLSAVVWMVILGDGLHNFTDGMAIGAAFSNNIAGGLSTAVAVFAHELPHELGDFAVLLKAGMSAKEAVYYNILSSILSFFGMVVGILIGDTPEASAWVFSIAAGLFIYIALVDMMPELTSTHGKDGCMLYQCFLQFLGMVCGFGTMWIIAMYEHDLKEMFTS